MFRAAAHNLRLWILVRETNAKTLERWVGQEDCVPKPVTCKAKTADMAHHPLAGLVVNPFVRPEAFSARRTPDAQYCWRQLAASWLRRPAGALIKAPRGGGIPYEVDHRPGRTRHGCLMVHAPSCPGRCGKRGCAKYIHGDYDLYDIVDPKHYARNEAVTVPVTTMFADRQSPQFRAVADYVNSRIGAPMIQHGAQMQHPDFGHSDEPLEVFSPKGKHSRTRGLSDNLALYSVTFRERAEV